MIDDESIKIVGGTAGAVVVGLILRLFLRMGSRDMVQVAGDRAEFAVIALLRAEIERQRQRADEAWALLREARADITVLRADVESLQKQLAQR